jgi:RND family efflux transporter MFP subunit
MDQLAGSVQVTKPDWALSRRERRRQALIAAGIEPYRFPWLIVLGVVVVLALAVFFLARLLAPPPAGSMPVSATVPQVAKRLLEIDVTTAAPATLQETIKATGSMASQRSISLVSQVNGTVETLNAAVGDKVQAGQTLVQMDAESASNELNQQRATAAATKAQLAQAESQLARTETLASSGLSATATLEADQARVEAARANLQALEAQVASAELTIRNTTVTAPFAGDVAERSVELGQVVSPGTALFKLVDLATMQLTAYVPVGTSPRVSVGQRVTLTVEGLDDQTFEGKVEAISPVAAEGTRTVPVKITVPNPDGRLRGGMFASGRIVVEQEDNLIAVPEGAIRTDADGSYVLAIEEGVLVRQAVTTGKVWSSSGQVAILSGLKAGQTFISGKLDDLSPGMSVTIVGG